MTEENNYQRFSGEGYFLDAIWKYDTVDKNYQIYVVYLDLKSKVLHSWRKINPVEMVVNVEAIHNVFMGELHIEDDYFIKAFARIGKESKFEEFEKGLELLDSKTQVVIEKAGKILNEDDYDVRDVDDRRNLENDETKNIKIVNYE